MADQTLPEQTSPEQTSPEQTPSYEQAREELLDVVRRLEAGGTTLEESLALWERAEQLAWVCQQWLDGARARLDQARERPGEQSGGRVTGAGVKVIDEAEG